MTQANISAILLDPMKSTFYTSIISIILSISASEARDYGRLEPSSYFSVDNIESFYRRFANYFNILDEFVAEGDLAPKIAGQRFAFATFLSEVHRTGAPFVGSRTKLPFRSWGPYQQFGLDGQLVGQFQPRCWDVQLHAKAVYEGGNYSYAPELIFFQRAAFASKEVFLAKNHEWVLDQSRYFWRNSHNQSFSHSQAAESVQIHGKKATILEYKNESVLFDSIDDPWTAFFWNQNPRDARTRMRYRVTTHYPMISSSAKEGGGSLIWSFFDDEELKFGRPSHTIHKNDHFLVTKFEWCSLQPIKP